MMMMIMAMVSLADLMPKIYVKYIIEQCVHVFTVTHSAFGMFGFAFYANDRMMQRDTRDNSNTISLSHRCEEQGKNYALYK